MVKIETIDKYVARALMVSFFLPVKAPVLMVLSLFYFLTRTVITREFGSKKSILFSFVLGSIYSLYLFSVPLTSGQFREMTVFLAQYKISILLAPLIIAILSPRFYAVILNELVYFAYACTISCLIGNIAFLYHFGSVGGLGAVNHVVYRIYFESINGIHPTYLGMYLCFSICILLCKTPDSSKVVNVFNLVVLYLLLVFLLCILPKSPVIALVLILFHFLFRHRKKIYQYKYFIVGVLVLMVLSYLLIPFFNQRLNELFLVFGNHKESIHENSVADRKLIWRTDMVMLKNYWLTGVGVGRLEEMLQIRYLFYSIAHGYSTGYYDPHNEYFYEWFSFGIAGIILLIIPLLVYIYSGIKHKNYLFVYLLLILIVTFFTESVLARQHGILFFSIFTSLFFFKGNTYRIFNDFNKL